MTIQVEYIRKGVPAGVDITEDDYRQATVSTLEAVVNIIKNEADTKSTVILFDGVELCETGSCMGESVAL